MHYYLQAFATELKVSIGERKLQKIVDKVMAKHDEENIDQSILVNILHSSMFKKHFIDRLRNHEYVLSQRRNKSLVTVR